MGTKSWKLGLRLLAGGVLPPPVVVCPPGGGGLGFMAPVIDMDKPSDKEAMEDKPEEVSILAKTPVK